MQYEFISTGYIPTNSFMNFGGDLIVVLAQKREGSVQGLYFVGYSVESWNARKCLIGNESSTQYQLENLKIFMLRNTTRKMGIRPTR